MDSVDATRPPTLTLEPAPNSTPLGFKTKTWPLARKLPKKLLGLLPVMRFSAIAWALGWANTRASLAAVDSFVQSMAKRWLVWVIVVVVAPDVITLPAPAVTAALAASAAWAGGVNAFDSASALSTVKAARHTELSRNPSPVEFTDAASTLVRPEPPLPRPLAFSATATHTLSAAFQTSR